ncbi:MAG: MerR family transcriptional regulator [Gemmatimonadaceae bacterium]|nr:MerR family transcriptional regulator [Gemmatimonadaceae bacterium]
MTRTVHEASAPDNEAPLKVGALAARTGVSVRTLHHYDAIGLLTPSMRTPSGHRLYVHADIARLQQIQSLRLTGLSLDEIRALLDGPGASAQHVVRLQLDRLEQQIVLQQRLVGRLKLLAQQLDAAAHIPMDELCRMIESTTMMDKYFTPAQLNAMHARSETLGVERVRAVEHAWAEVIPAVRAHMARNTPPTDTALQSLARRWRTLVTELTGGDREIARNARRMYQEEHAAISAGQATMPDPAMFAFMNDVFREIGGGPG